MASSHIGHAKGIPARTMPAGGVEVSDHIGHMGMLMAGHRIGRTSADQRRHATHMQITRDTMNDSKGHLLCQGGGTVLGERQQATRVHRRMAAVHVGCGRPPPQARGSASLTVALEQAKKLT